MIAFCKVGGDDGEYEYINLDIWTRREAVAQKYI